MKPLVGYGCDQLERDPRGNIRFLTVAKGTTPCTIFHSSPLPPDLLATLDRRGGIEVSTFTLFQNDQSSRDVGEL